MAVYSFRKMSPLRRNTYFCCSWFDVKLYDIFNTNRSFVSLHAINERGTKLVVLSDILRDLIDVRATSVLASAEFQATDVKSQWHCYATHPERSDTQIYLIFVDLPIG